jgi:hypothetical protein
MNLQDLQEIENGLIYDISLFSELDNVCVLNNLDDPDYPGEIIPLPVDAISSSYQQEDDIEIYDENDDFLGVLCFCKFLGEQVNIREISPQKYIAYINEVDKTSFENNIPFRFRKDYLVLQKSRYEDYKNKYMKSAPLWGGFFHETINNPLYKAYQFKPNKIVAFPDINIPTSYHQESCIRSVVQPYAFERFLKLYHLLELSFDYDLVQQIKALDISTNLQGIERLLSLYSSSKELNKINALIESRYQQGKINIDRIAASLNKIKLHTDYLQKGIKIFFYYNKEGNPYQDKWTPLPDLMAEGGFDRQNTKEGKPTKINGITQAKYDEIVYKVAAYWIYRIRSCIAHNRIGEYVLLNEDEEFIVEFAEPLIRELIYQIFS